MQHGLSKCIHQDSLPNAIVQDDTHEWTALHEAAASGNDNKLQMLLVGNIMNRLIKEHKLGNTPLHEAAWRGYSRCVKILCTFEEKRSKALLLEKHGVSLSTFLNTKNDNGFTALHLSAQNGHNQSCRELLLAGADHDIQNNYGDTPLHTACRYGHAGACRIMLSASCDPSKSNLNGDTPLHISCAMGRRKLTRILLEAGSDKGIRNAQNETPHDIAARKSYREIIDILKNAQTLFKKHGKNRSRKRDTDHTGCIAKVNWSPYGCHYFPDPRAFPSPKLETLPKEPLEKGEQYYLDLAGNIHKGPIGVASACYCEPFFRHIENKLNSDRKSLRRYVHRAKESLGNKVQALAIETNKQIEQLTRSIIADRVRCESRRMHLDRCLKRGQPLRQSAEYHGPRKQYAATDSLNRSRSLELLDDNSLRGRNLFNSASSKSRGLLEENAIIIHQPAHQPPDNESDYEDGSCDEIASISSSNQSCRQSISSGKRAKRLDFLDVDYYTISERLGELLAKTSVILENETTPESIQEQGSDFNFNKSAHTNATPPCLKANNTHFNNDDDLDDKRAKVLESAENIAQSHRGTQPERPEHCKVPCIQELDNPQMFTSLGSNDSALIRNVIKVLQNDPHRVKAHIEKQMLNEFEHTRKDKLQYKLGNHVLNGHELYRIDDCVSDTAGKNFNHMQCPVEQVITDCLSIANNKMSQQKSEKQANAVDKAEHLKSDDMKLNQPLSINWRHKFVKNVNNSELERSIGVNVEKVEIRNSEIKSLKKPAESEKVKRNKVHELVARIQGKLTESQKAKQNKLLNVVNDSKLSGLENKELEENNNNEHRSLKDFNTSPPTFAPQLQNSIIGSQNSNIVCSPTLTGGIQNLEETFAGEYSNNKSSFDSQGHFQYVSVPKDAYFHDIPKKRANQLQANSNSVGLQSSEPSAHPSAYRNTCAVSETSHRLLNSTSETPVSSNKHVTASDAAASSRIYDNGLFIQRRLLSPAMCNLEGCGISSEYEIATMNCFQKLQSQSKVQLNSALQLSRSSAEPYFVERDFSNDSGFSIRTIGGSQRPSPNLSDHLSDNRRNINENRDQVVNGYMSTIYTPVLTEPRGKDSVVLDELNINNLSSLV